MGLLQRSLAVSPDNALSKESRSPLDFFESLTAQDSASLGNFEYPSTIFYSFRENVPFSMGALLFPDSTSRGFYPWISAGIDQTTVRRIWIPSDAPPLSSTKEAVLDSWDSSFLTSMLSSRTQRLVQFPFIIRLGNPSAPSALLLILDGFKDGMDPNLRKILNSRCIELGKNLDMCRGPLLPPDEKGIEDPQEWLRSWGDQEAMILVLDIRSALNSLVDTANGIDVYHMQQDTANFLRHVTGRTGRFFNLKDGRVFLLIPAKRFHSKDLYLQQFSRIFQNLTRSEKPPTLSVEVLNWPADRHSVEAFFPSN